MRDYVHRRLTAQKAIQDIDALIAEVDNKMWDMRSVRKGSATTTISATIVAHDDTKAELRLSYLVSGVGWKPYYDLHATTAGGRPSADVSMLYCATITQESGEDWADTMLTLSTATSQAQRKLSVPTLAPLIIKPKISNLAALPTGGVLITTDNVQPGGARSGTQSVRNSMHAMPCSLEQSTKDTTRVSLARETPISAMNWATSNAPVSIASRSALSVAYHIDGAVSLPSDGEAHRLTVATLAFKAALQYVCVPFETQAAFIVGTVKNTSEYDLLAGPVNVFMDDGFVSKTSLEFIAVNESFECVLGVDTALKVTFRQESKTEHEPRRSFAEPIKMTIRTTTTTISNQHPHAVSDLIVRDAIPLGNEDAKVSVTLRKPAGLAEALEGDEVVVDDGDGEGKEGGASAKVRWSKVVDGKGGEKDGLYEWVCVIPAGKKISLETQCDIKGPSDVEWETVARGLLG
ncbi:hypothetical protein C8Q77DRAFT_637351 [Trametes polyzona]|nr:hypothetical protein C8Q77DRAFT_637351 [Trametes polyzona]